MKKTLMVFIGLGAAIFLFWYVNTYIYKFLASTDPVSVNMTPTKERIDLTGKSDEEFNVAFQVSNQDVSGMELYLTYDAKYLQYGKEYDTAGGFIQPENFQYDVLLEEVTELDDTKKQAKLILVATSEIPETPNNARLLNFKFKAIAVDPEDAERIDDVLQQITLDMQSQFVGASEQGEAAQFANPTDPVLASVTIFRGTGDITPGPSETGPAFGFQPSSSQAKVNEPFSVEITFDAGNEEVAGVDIYLNFDSDMMQASYIEGKNFFPITQQATMGQTAYISQVVDQQGAYKTGKGTLARIEFTPFAAGTTEITFSCDPSKDETSKIIRNDVSGTNVIDCSKLSPHTVTITSSSSDDPTPTQIQQPTPTKSTSSGETADVELNMKVRFQGITKQPVAAYDTMNVRVDLEGSRGFKNDQVVQFKADGSGLWNGVMKINDVPLSEEYAVLIKGPKHLSRKICQATPQENVPGTYRCENNGEIELKEGGNNLDFSNVVILAGDIPVQNQVVDAADIIFIRQNFGNTGASALTRGDLNLDGIIDTQDYSLVMAALGFKYDEEL